MARCSAMESSRAVEKWNAELAFRPVVEATADKAGLDFMRHLVKNLALSLRVEHAFVAEFAGDERHVKTIAYWSSGDWVPNVEFPLAGTPCERVVEGHFCLYKDDVHHLFPADTALTTLGIRSYLGVPLRDADGRTLGHLAALDTRPMEDDPRGMAIFHVLANRAPDQELGARSTTSRAGSRARASTWPSHSTTSRSPTTSSRRCSRSTFPRPATCAVRTCSPSSRVA
jgi:GAF domain-containing protein